MESKVAGFSGEMTFDQPLPEYTSLKFLLKKKLSLLGKSLECRSTNWDRVCMRRLRYIIVHLFSSDLMNPFPRFIHVFTHLLTHLRAYALTQFLLNLTISCITLKNSQIYFQNLALLNTTEFLKYVQPFLNNIIVKNREARQK